MPPQKPLIHALPYYPDSSRLFASIAADPWSVFLDSGYPISRQGRYDIIATKPYCTLVTTGAVTEIKVQGAKTLSRADPFQLVKQQLLPAATESLQLPFCGGAIGYFSYDLARRLETFPVIARDAENIPEMVVGIYDWAIIIDHHLQSSQLVGQCRTEETRYHWDSLIDRFSQTQDTIQQQSFRVLDAVQSNMSKESYAQAFARIKHYLQEGDCYQVNLAQRFSCLCEGEPWVAYQLLRQLNAAPFSAYLNFPQVQVLSSSPERFLKVMDRAVETKPIKGTRPRKKDVAADNEQIRMLSESVKDRAENLMIVDLLRNDISKSCRQGSVRVPELFAVESFATVHHLVSTIIGELDINQHALDLLRSCFPGGSITGAPKIRAMEIIEELEPDRRGVYCGSIAYIGFDGNMDSNIAIRTLVHSANIIRFWAGGGIVIDSTMEAEYQESFDKAAAMLQLLQQLGSKS
jgi:para-aminobenzoate synthetase component I